MNYEGEVSQLTVRAFILQIDDASLSGPEVRGRRPPRLLAQLADPRVCVVGGRATLVERRGRAEVPTLGQTRDPAQLLVGLSDVLVLGNPRETVGLAAL